MISGVDDAAVERIVQGVLDAIGRGEGESPAELLLLLRRYVSTGRPELSEALGTALARALDRCASPDRREERSSEWLGVFVEAAAISQDERLPAAAASMVASLRRNWPGRGELRPSFRAVESCLAAAHLGNEDDVATSAIDELERIVGRSVRAWRRPRRSRAARAFCGGFRAADGICRGRPPAVRHAGRRADSILPPDMVE